MDIAPLKGSRQAGLMDRLMVLTPPRDEHMEDGEWLGEKKITFMFVFSLTTALKSILSQESGSKPNNNKKRWSVGL